MIPEQLKVCGTNDMKAFLIYVKDHLESTAQAEKALLSCKDTGFDVELVEGITPLTVDEITETFV